MLQRGLIGLVIPEVTSPYFAELAGHLVHQAEARSWMLLVQQTDGDADRERRLLEAAVARAALDCLADRLAREPYAGPARRITIAHELVIRQSTAG